MMAEVSINSPVLSRGVSFKGKDMLVNMRRGFTVANRSLDQPKDQWIRLSKFTEGK